MSRKHFKTGNPQPGEHQYHVYVTYNPQTGEYYIGSSTGDPSKRRNGQDRYIGSFTHDSWLKLKDKSILQKQILKVCDTVLEARRFEAWMITIHLNKCDNVNKSNPVKWLKGQRI